MLDLGPNERDALIPATSGKLRLLGEKAIPGMNRITKVLLGGSDHRVDVQIATGAVAREGMDCIGGTHVQACRIVRCVYRDGAQSEVACRPRDADGDFTAISDE